MSDVSDYIGRTVDVSAFQGTQLVGRALLLQALAAPGEGGRAVTGIIKLGQRFLVALLNEKGSSRHFPIRGSTFLTELRLGYIRTPAELYAAFSRALLDVSRNLTSDETSEDQPDERFLSAKIVAVDLVDGDASVDVLVTSRAQAVSVVLPIQVSLR